MGRVAVVERVERVPLSSCPLLPLLRHRPSLPPAPRPASSSLPPPRPAMPVSRHRAQRENSRQAYAESDSDGDTEREQTPRPPAARNLSKKRLSERFDPDGSFTLEDATNGPTKARPPLKSVNINDDVAEKRRRRKSAKVTLPLEPEDEPEAGPSNSANTHDGADTPAEGSRADNLARQKSQLLNLPQAPVINVPMDVMTSNFDQWMKMATDNVRLLSIIHHASLVPGTARARTWFFLFSLA